LGEIVAAVSVSCARMNEPEPDRVESVFLKREHMTGGPSMQSKDRYPGQRRGQVRRRLGVAHARPLGRVTRQPGHGGMPWGHGVGRGTRWVGAGARWAAARGKAGVGRGKRATGRWSWAMRADWPGVRGWAG
jgi:hypothetical protein